MATSAAYIDHDEGAAPATPGASKVRIYAKADGLMYSKDDAGTETLMSGGAGGGGGIASGTSLPGAPSDGDLFFKTDFGDAGALLVYDGTNTEWVTQQLYQIPYRAESITASALIQSHGFDSAGPDVRVVRLTGASAVATTNSVTHHWDIDHYVDAAGSGGGGGTLVGELFDTSAHSPSAMTSHAVAVDYLLDVSVNNVLTLFAEKISSPGALRLYGSWYWRYIVT